MTDRTFETAKRAARRFEQTALKPNLVRIEPPILCCYQSLLDAGCGRCEEPAHVAMAGFAPSDFILHGVCRAHATALAAFYAAVPVELPEPAYTDNDSGGA